MMNLQSQASTDICPVCKAWRATTEKQLANRLRNMHGAPNAQPFACLHYGSTDWATAREMIKPEQPPWWRRLFRW